MFNLNLLTYSLLSLQRRWKKYLLILCIYALIVAFFASILFFTTALRYEMRLVLVDIPQIWVQKIAGGRLEPIAKAWVDSLQSIRGVQKVVPRIWGYNFDSPTGAVFTIIGSEVPLQGLTLITAKYKEKLAPNMALCGTGFLSMRGLQIGDNLTLLDSQGNIQSMEIVGSFRHEADLLTQDLIVMHPQMASKILGLAPDKATDVGLFVSNSAEIDNIARKIDKRMAGVRVVTAKQLEATYEALFSWRGSIFVYGGMLSLLAFFVLVAERASSYSNAERREIGVLKAVGWQISQVLWIKFYEGLFISLSAIGIGILIAYWHIFLMGGGLFKSLLMGWSVLYPSYDLIPIIQATDLVLIIALAAIPYLSATLIPAWRLAITDTAEALMQ